MQNLSSHDRAPQTVALSRQDDASAMAAPAPPEAAPPLPPDVVCAIVNRLPDTHSLAMLAGVSHSYRSLTSPMLQFLDPMVTHRRNETEPPRWLLTEVAGHLCRLALVRSHRQTERQARLTVAAVLAQVARLQDARQRVIALDGEALRHIVWVADHGKDVPEYFRLVFALPPALCMAVCAELLHAPPLRIRKAGELSVPRREKAPDYYVAIEARFIEQFRAAVKADAKPNQPGQALRCKALMSLLPDVIAQFSVLCEQGHASGEQLVMELSGHLEPFIDRVPGASEAAQRLALVHLFDAMLRYVLRHLNPSEADAMLPRLQRQAEGSGCMDGKAWRELLGAIRTDIACARQDAARTDTTGRRRIREGAAPGLGAPVVGNDAGAFGATASPRRQ